MPLTVNGGIAVLDFRIEVKAAALKNENCPSAIGQLPRHSSACWARSNYDRIIEIKIDFFSEIDEQVTISTALALRESVIRCLSWIREALFSSNTMCQSTDRSGYDPSTFENANAGVAG